MKRLILATGLVVLCGACFAIGQLSAEEDEVGGMPMPEWTKKGEEHAGFAKHAGEWDVANKFWMAPDAPPMESTGSASTSLLWDGRFVEMDYQGEMMGTPFEGRLLMAFDRVDEEYVAIWIDSLSTYLSVSRGKAKDGVVTFETNDPDWMTGKKKKAHMTMKWVDDDTYVLTVLEPVEGGEARTTMEMTYTRKQE